MNKNENIENETIIDVSEDDIIEDNTIENNTDDLETEKTDDTILDKDTVPYTHTLTVKLNKSKNGKLNVFAVHADYSPNLALSDLEYLLDDEDFSNSIDNNTITYNIIDTNGDDYNIEETITLEPSIALNDLIYYATEIYSKMTMLHFATIELDDDEIYDMTYQYMLSFIEDIDLYGTAIVSYEDCCCNPLSVLNCGRVLENTTISEALDYISTVSEDLNKYADYISLYKYNFAEDMQELNSLIEYWKDAADYFSEFEIKQD